MDTALNLMAQLMQLSPNAPRVLFVLLGLAMLLAMRQYKRKNDVSAWMRDMYAKTTKAASDEAFRQAELADAEKKLAKYPVPNPVKPITNRQQIRIAAFPKFIFMTGLTSAVFLYFGLFETMLPPERVMWPVYVGWGFLALTLVLYILAEMTRPYYSRVQQINRKYLLQKAGGEKERFESLRQVLEYYPHLPELWLELGDQYAVSGQMDKAVDAIEKARTLAPDNMDLAIVLASFELRRKHRDKALKALDEAERLKKNPSDPRVEIYRAAVALQNNEKRKAEKLGEKALELDKEFTAKLVQKDDGLKDLAVLWQPLLAGEGVQDDSGAAEEEKNEETSENDDSNTQADVTNAMAAGEKEG